MTVPVYAAPYQGNILCNTRNLGMTLITCSSQVIATELVICRCDSQNNVLDFSMSSFPLARVGLEIPCLALQEVRFGTLHFRTAEAPGKLHAGIRVLHYMICRRNRGEYRGDRSSSI